MKRALEFMFITLMVLGFTGQVNAALIDCGGGLIYVEELDITLLQDFNYVNTSDYDTDGFMNWNDANEWTDGLEYYDVTRDATFDEWRLPTIEEIVYVGSEYGITPWTQGPFSNVMEIAYWSATETSPSSAYAYFGTPIDTLKDFERGIEVVFDGSPVPIPSALWLLISGVVGLVGIRRRFGD